MNSDHGFLGSVFFSTGIAKVKFAIGVMEFADLSGRAIDYLSEGEQEIYKGLRVGQRRRQFLAGRYIAKECVCQDHPSLQRSSINIVNGAWGGPLIHSEHLQNTLISISHTDNFAAALFSASNMFPAGMDIEEIRDDQIPSLQNFMSPREREILLAENLPYKEALHLMWSAKEAAGKALMVGFNLPEDCYHISSFASNGNSFHIGFENLPILQCIGWLKNNLSVCVAVPSILSFEKLEIEPASILAIKTENLPFNGHC